MTHTFNINSRSIRLVASHKGKQYKLSTGLTIDPSLWNREAKTLPAKCRDRRVWDKLRGIHIRATEMECRAETEEDVLRVMAYAITGKMPEKNAPAVEKKLSFWEYFEEWVYRNSTQVRQKKLCYRNIEKFMGRDFIQQSPRHSMQEVEDFFSLPFPFSPEDAGRRVRHQLPMEDHFPTEDRDERGAETQVPFKLGVP